ncbi:radical SAM domain-containing protein [Toxoplasma gondii GAB2-2007-GAL-DOM2]|uniref:GTP 3',8-cyclase n=2 Tax=Toxoplasma gondii TaxID=5811 RepID=V4ZEK1_TOXGV|nr:radical SAM domain-containing protein [Toxoplasma gondii VEG]KFG40262.1 radical SAM domain-containing protein [Toxoplasma gondii GAB2-2007-GAL-DOM2]
MVTGFWKETSDTAGISFFSFSSFVAQIDMSSFVFSRPAVSRPQCLLSRFSSCSSFASLASSAGRLNQRSSFSSSLSSPFPFSFAKFSTHLPAIVRVPPWRLFPRFPPPANLHFACPDTSSRPSSSPASSSSPVCPSCPSSSPSSSSCCHGASASPSPLRLPRSLPSFFASQGRQQGPQRPLNGCGELSEALSVEGRNRKDGGLLVNPPALLSPLTDTFGRHHTYLRISLTEKCNMNCVYCSPCGSRGQHSGKAKSLSVDSVERSNAVLSTDEIIRVASVFLECGGRKIRLTGGEPTIRKDFSALLTRVGALPNLETFAVTTNGVRLLRWLPEFKLARVNAVNVSLDSLDPSRYRAITGVNAFHRVWEGIMQLIAEDFCLVKLNVVLLRRVNVDEVDAFAALTRDLPIHVRFIEFMPFQGNRWSHEAVVTKQEILERLRHKYPGIHPVESKTRGCMQNSQADGVHRHRRDTRRGQAAEGKNEGEGDGAKKGSSCNPEETEEWKIDENGQRGEEGQSASLFVIPGHAGCIGIISALTDSFCASCNRIRLTADGQLKNCLFSPSEFTLLPALRSASSSSTPHSSSALPCPRGEESERIKQTFASALGAKKASHGGIMNIARQAHRNRPMIRIGG